MKTYIDKGDVEGLLKKLTAKPELANKAIRFGPFLKHSAHPLHYINDGVFSKQISQEVALGLAKVLVSHGAKIDGYSFEEMKDTPLVAASSLHSDLVAIYLIDQGADIHHAGCHGGTAIHWAAWTGADTLVERLLQEELDINRRCIDHKSTAFFWAIHGLKRGGEKNLRNQVRCAQLLKDAGADMEIPNAEGVKAIELLDPKTDLEAMKVFESATS